MLHFVLASFNCVKVSHFPHPLLENCTLHWYCTPEPNFALRARKNLNKFTNINPGLIIFGTLSLKSVFFF